MQSSNFNLRNIPSHVMGLLKKEAAKQKISVNSLLLHIVEKDLGITPSKKKMIYHDLDHLAGTWNSKDKNEFENNVKSFESIETELWL